MHIALAFDENFAKHGITTIESILANGCETGQLRFSVIDVGLSNSTKDLLYRRAAEAGAIVDYLEISETFLRTFPTTHHAASAYARIALPRMLGDDDRVLYIDSDTLVRKPLDDLWAIDIGQKFAAAVRDSWFAIDPQASHFRQLGPACESFYFNSGVMLLNLQACRQADTEGQSIAWTAMHRDLILKSDQDVLNAVFQGNVTELHPRWNLQTQLIPLISLGFFTERNLNEALRDPTVVHFTGEAKPWLFAHATPYRREYWNFRRKNFNEKSAGERPSWGLLGSRVIGELRCVKHRLNAWMKIDRLDTGTDR